MKELSQISALMSSPVVVVSPIDTLAHARNILLREKINRLIVVDDSSLPIGVLTRSDIAREVSSRNPGREAALDRVLVREVMTKSPVSLKPSDSALRGAQTMLRQGISGVPIVDETGKLDGILSKSDLTRYYAENCPGLIKIDEVETHEVTTIPSNYTLYRAEDLMRRQRIGRLIVVNGKTPLGIITQRDLSFADYPSRGPQDKFRRTRSSDSEDDSHTRNVRLPEEATVEKVMRSPPITIRENEYVDEAARLMVKEGIGGVPVVDDENQLSGIITKTDVVKALIIYESRRSKTTPG